MEEQLDREKMTHILWNEMDDLLEKAKQNGIVFTFSARPSGYYNDEDYIFIHSNEDNFDFSVE